MFNIGLVRALINVLNIIIIVVIIKYFINEIRIGFGY